MSASTRSRRYRDKEQRRAAANRRIGHDLAYVYFWGPKVAVVAAIIVAAVGVRWVWTHVDHDQIAGIVGAGGAALIALWAVWQFTAGSGYGRRVAAARGQTRSLTMPIVGAAGLLLVVGAVLLWRSQA